MFQCEHFVYALFNNLGYKTLKTGRLDVILTTNNLYNLQRLPERSQTYVHWLETEQLVAFSKVRGARDEYDRKGVWNHTLLIHINDYLAYTQTRPAETLDAYFLRELPSPSTRLEPIQIK